MENSDVSRTPNSLDKTKENFLVFLYTKNIPGH